MAIVNMSIGAWMLLGLKAGCALAITTVITELVRNVVMGFIEGFFGGNE